VLLRHCIFFSGGAYSAAGYLLYLMFKEFFNNTISFY
jgi:hypothetical protein